MIVFRPEMFLFLWLSDGELQLPSVSHVIQLPVSLYKLDHALES